MCCYVRHLRPQLPTIGLPDDRAGRREADRRIRVAFAMQDADCPDVWRRVKAMPADEVAALMQATAPSEPGRLL